MPFFYQNFPPPPPWLEPDEELCDDEPPELLDLGFALRDCVV